MQSVFLFFGKVSDRVLYGALHRQVEIQEMTIEYSRLHGGSDHERRVYTYEGARVAIELDARSILDRLRASTRVATSQKANLIAEFESLLRTANTPESACRLDELAKRTSKILKHVE